MVFPVGIGQHPASKIVRVHWSTRELEPVFLKNQKQESTRGRGVVLPNYGRTVKRPYLVFAASTEAIFPTIKTVIVDVGHHGPDKNVREAAGSAAQGNIKIKSPNCILPGHSYQGIIEHCSHAGYISAVSHPPFISIIDDDESVREALWGLVRSVGFAVSTFASAEELLNSGHLGNADCLILDVRMPGMGGIELQRQLVAGRCDVPVIFITAHEDEGMRAQALRGGAEAVLIKPFSEELLLGAIDAALSPR